MPRVKTIFEPPAYLLPERMPKATGRRSAKRRKHIESERSARSDDMHVFRLLEYSGPRPQVERMLRKGAVPAEGEREFHRQFTRVRSTIVDKK